MTLHDLKILPEYFAAILDGRKRFELRRYEWDFKLDDRLRLREFDGYPASKYTGREITVRVVYMLEGPFGERLDAIDLVLMGFELITCHGILPDRAHEAVLMHEMDGPPKRSMGAQFHESSETLGGAQPLNVAEFRAKIKARDARRPLPLTYPLSRPVEKNLTEPWVPAWVAPMAFGVTWTTATYSLWDFTPFGPVDSVMAGLALGLLAAGVLPVLVQPFVQAFNLSRKSK